MAFGAHGPMTMPEFIKLMAKKKSQWETLAPARATADQIKDIVYRSIGNNFSTASSPAGGEWPPHAPSTIARYGPHPLLVLTGHLKESVTASGASGNYEVVTDTKIVIGTTVAYAAVQNYGNIDQTKVGAIPARTFVAIAQSAVNEIHSVVRDYIVFEIFA